MSHLLDIMSSMLLPLSETELRAKVAHDLEKGLIQEAPHAKERGSQRRVYFVQVLRGLSQFDWTLVETRKERGDWRYAVAWHAPNWKYYIYAILRLDKKQYLEVVTTYKAPKDK